MKVVEITGPGECQLVDRADPKIADNYVLVKNLVAPMCTEVQQFRNGDRSDCLGHEAAGEVVQTFPGSRVSVGQRVVVMPQNGCGLCPLCLAGMHIRCQTPRGPSAVTQSETGRATYAQYVIQQDWLLLPVPEDISIEHASMACCGLGPTFAACHAMNMNALDTVLVSGLGAVGLGAVVNARVRGARVLGIEGHPFRADLARSLGAEQIFDPADPDLVAQIRSATGGHGADVSIEASSQESAPGTLIQATRIGGKLGSVGWGGPVQMRDVVARGVSIQGFWHWNHLHDSEAMFRTIRQAGSLLDKLITHRFPMSRVKDAWELQSTGKCGKILLDPWN